MDGQSYGIQWIQHHAPSGGDMKTTGQLIIDAQPPEDEEIMANGGGGGAVQYLIHGIDDCDDEGGVVVHHPTATDIDQIAAENLIFMRDGQVVSEIIASAHTDENGAVVVAASDGTRIECSEEMLQQAVAAAMSAHAAANEMTLQQDDDNGCGGEEDDVDDCDTVGVYTADYSETTPQMVTEEVITDDWVQHQGEERVEIPADQIIGSHSQVLLDIEVPLPTVQDEYTALRPYPCDFCSRRFRKKASLMNHMVAHQNDRPHLCKLCGSRFFRRSDLINHLKAHAEAPDPEFDDADFITFVEQEQEQQQQQRHPNDHYYDQDWSMQPDVISSSSMATARSNRKVANTATAAASGNSSSASSSTTAATQRGRISRLKPKEENYTINESLPHQQQQQQHLLQHHHSALRANSAELEYVECQELQASTAAVKLTQDHSPAHHQRHYPIIDDSKPFVCQQCGLAFAREKALMSHSKNHRNDSPYECAQCNEMFWDATSLQEHQKTHQFEESNSEYDPGEAAEDTQSESESEHLYGEFYCSECGMSFHRQDLLRRHARVAHVVNSASAPHQGDVTASTTTTTADHNNKDQHCCSTCGETFGEALDLLAHAEIHARYPPFKCVLCGESFFEEQTIKRHLQNSHAAEMTANSCILCGKECRDRKALIKHAWDHSREKCHSCSKCGKNFHNKARLKRHMASHRDKSVACDVCQEEFPDGRTLSNHRHSHSATASGKLFPCHECGKTFGSRSSQQIHVRIHTGERPYGCRFCWKAFADGGTLRKHERIHTGEKPYACSVCPRAFNQRVVLREHIRSHHSGLDAKRGTYFCTVCTAELDSSGDLIQHLIGHSDMNTAMQRQPITGPRKYKRRRKLKPHEIARLRSEGGQNGNGSDIDISDFDMENVDDLLGMAEATTANNNAATLNTSSTTRIANTKRNKASRGGGEREEHNNNNNNSGGGDGGRGRTATAGGSKNNAAALTEDDDDEEDEEDEEHDEEEEEDEEEEQDLLSEQATTATHSNNKQRYNSTSSNSEKLWQTKLIPSSSQDESYKSLLSNLENTLQSIDTLVVSNNNHHSTSNDGRRGPINYSEKEASSPPETTTAQRTQQVKINKSQTLVPKETTKSRKKPEKKPTPTRPRMIHTEKWRADPTAATAGSKRKRKATVIACSSAFGGLPRTSSTSIVDDYEIISPDTKPPNQISSSPLHIKQEPQQTRIADLYNAQLLLEASTLRKQTYEKYNPSIVNDLEEILRSPVKSDRRDRFTSESSTTQFLSAGEEETHLIKIEPTSPDLREIVAGSGGSNMDARSTRHFTRSRQLTANRKYLEFESDVTPGASRSATAHKRAAAAAHKTKTAKTLKKEATTITSSRSLSASTSYLSYAVDSFHHSVGGGGGASPATTDAAVASSFASISAVVSAADASAAAAAASAAPSSATERKPQRYFECEMCSAVFPDRAQLLDHVPIHI